MVKNSSDNLDKINDQIFLDGNNPLLRAQEQLTQLDLEKALDTEERFWLDKSKVKWKLEGDINTLFFHRMARIKNSKNIIYVLKDGDRLIHDPGDLAYFTDLFCFAGSPQDLEIVNDVIPQLLDSNMNTLLTRIPSHEEIRMEVFSLNQDSTLSLYGFG